MKAIEFQARINPDQSLTAPPQIAELLVGRENVRVLLLIPETSEDEDWERLTAEEFFNGYAASDAIYDNLPAS